MTYAHLRVWETLGAPRRKPVAAFVTTTHASGCFFFLFIRNWFIRLCPAVVFQMQQYSFRYVTVRQSWRLAGAAGESRMTHQPSMQLARILWKCLTYICLTLFDPCRGYDAHHALSCEIWPTALSTRCSCCVHSSKRVFVWVIEPRLCFRSVGYFE